MSGFSVRTRLLAIVVLLFAAAGFNTVNLYAQTSYGSVVGTVTDASGAVVSGATVILTDVSTNEQRTAQTNTTGEYSFVSLIPATYAVDVQQTGFKRFRRDQIVVEVNQTVRVNAALQVGAATETVEVNTETPQLQTDSGTLNTVVEGKTIEEMPLNGRNPMNLLALAPGVQPADDSGGAAALGTGGSTHTSNWSDFSIGGGLRGQSTMYLDGMPLNVLGAGGGSSGIEFVPTQDAVQEFSVATNAASSEFGRYSGGVVNMATKSGTNSWHGTLYEFVRNNILNANEWWNKNSEYQQLQQGLLSPSNWNKRPQWNQNQYGVEVGGPIKKDKLFAMFSWEEFSAREASLQQRPVPTSDMLNGILDFNTAALATSSAAAINALKPACNAVANGSQVILNGGQSIYKVGSGNGCYDPTALVIATEWPAANTVSNQNNFNKLSGYGSGTATYTARVDYNLSPSQQLFARFTEAKLQDISQAWMPGGIMPSGQPWNIGGGATENRATSGVLGDTYTFNPKTILDLRASVSRVYLTQVPTAAGSQAILASLGPNWAALGATETVPNIPQTNFTDSCSGFICTPQTFQNAGTLSYQWNDNSALVFSLTKIVGQHNLKMGGETRFMDRYVTWMVGNNAVGGTLNFSNQDFAQSAWGNFLLGYPDQAQINTVRKVASYNWYQGYYINDTWQATHKLTINAGVRWELPGNIKEKHDDSIELLPAATLSYNNVTVPGAVALVNSPAYPDRGSEPARHDQFAPNLGFAFRLTDNDVIRGGYGYAIAPIDIASGLFPENYSLNSASTSWNYQQTGVHYSLSNPFPTSAYPNGLNQPIPRSAFTPQSLIGQQVTAPVPSLVLPVTQQWNLTLSHQFSGELVINVGYAGSKATGLPINTNSGYSYNELPYQYWNDRSMPLLTSASVPTLVTPGQLATCSAVWGTTTYGQCALPYSSYQTFNDAFGPYGFVNYQSLPVQVRKRFKSGGMVQASYTWEKTLGNAGGGTANGPGAGGNIQDWYNLRAEKSLTSYSVPRRLVISSVLPLPIGRNQMFLKGLSNPVANGLVSGWEANAITTFQDGFPLGIGMNPGAINDIPEKFGSGLRPNYQFGCPTMAGGSWRSHVWAGTPVLNVNCWSAPPIAYYENSAGAVSSSPAAGYTGYATTLGNAPRVQPNVRAPGQNNWDISLQKNTALMEKTSLVFRAEMFNAFNHVRFPAPNTTLGGNGFGSITNGSQGQGEEPRLIQLSLRLNF